MNALALKKTLQSLIAQKLSVCVWGASGVGKTSVVKELAETLNLPFIELPLYVLDNAVLLENFLNEHEVKGGLLFLRGLNLATPSIQNAAYQLLVHGVRTKATQTKDWMVIASAINEEQHAQKSGISPSLANCFVHIDMQTSLDTWRSWAYTHHIDPYIIAFLETHPHYLFSGASQERSFPTPRTWEFADKILRSDIDASLLFEALSGTIGPEEAKAFLGFKETLEELPDYHAIFSGRSSYYPQDRATLQLLRTTLVTQALRHPEKIALNNMLRYTLKMDAEFAVKVIKDLQTQGVRFDRLEAWRDWTSQFKEAMESC